jgi:hypothetical protein
MVRPNTLVSSCALLIPGEKIIIAIEKTASRPFFVIMQL